jgi:NADP-dependent 3-hydroxy acid dehydrogenase YdfG
MDGLERPPLSGVAMIPGQRQDPKTRDLGQGLAVVTGAGSGIGRAIALQLAGCGVPCCLVGRTLSKLEDVANLASAPGVELVPMAVDLCNTNGIAGLVRRIKELGRPIGLLVHSAALMSTSRVEESTVAEFTALLNVNVLAPFALTKYLLPEICASRGQIVFVNSSIVNNAAAGTMQYAATKYALKGLADGLRQEVNVRGVRVISVYPGRTATPLQASVYAGEGRQYRPEILLQPEDIAATVIHALALPDTAEVTDIMIRPAIKS